MDKPNVVIFPPLLTLIALAVTVILRFTVPLPIGSWIVCVALGIVFLALAATMIRSAFSTMDGIGTNISPNEPSTAIAVTGPYRFTRNPIYIGMMSFLIACSLFMNTWWGIVVLVPVFLIFHFGVILREETYLTKKFGEKYLSYTSAVRRYF